MLNTKVRWSAMGLVAGVVLLVLSAALSSGLADVIFTPPGGKFAGPVDVYFGVTNPDPETLATIYYTVDGTEPTDASPRVASGNGIRLTNTTVIKAREGFSYKYPDAFPVFTATYIIGFEVIDFTPPPGEYSSEQLVQIVTPNAPDAAIHYTLDGSTPSSSSPVFSASDPIRLTGPATIKAFAWHPEHGTGIVQSAAYTFKTAPVTFDPAPGYYPRNTPVSLQSATPGSTLSYALGSLPFNEVVYQFLHWQPYSGPISIASNLVIHARAEKPGYETTYASGVFHIPRLPRPEFSPVRGPIAPGTHVAITSPVEGATIRYTLDGADPTEASSKYAGPVVLPANTKLKARAYLYGFDESHVRYTYYRGFSEPISSSEPTTEPPHLKFTGVSGAAEPIWIANAGDGTGRLFFAERGGNIRIVGQSEPFLTLPYAVQTGGLGQWLPSDFGGLVSAAFPPDYDSKAYFYVSYLARYGRVRVSRFAAIANPNVADPSSETTIGTYSVACGGGQLVFAPDGTLYLNLGGPVANPMSASFFQDPDAVAGKMIPILVESGAGTILSPAPASWRFTAYATSTNCTTRGGLLYRGLGKRMQGRHFFGSQTGDFLGVVPDSTGLRSTVLARPKFVHPRNAVIIVQIGSDPIVPEPTVPFDFSAVGEDEAGRLYVANRGTIVYGQGAGGLPTAEILGGGIYRVEDEETIFSVRPKLQGDGRLTLEWHGAAGYQHHFQLSEDLLSWQDYLSPFAGTGETLSLRDLDPATHAKQFFRVRLMAP